MWRTEIWQITIVSVRLWSLYAEFYIMGRMLYFFSLNATSTARVGGTQLTWVFLDWGFSGDTKVLLSWNSILHTLIRLWYNGTTQVRVNWSSHQRQKDACVGGYFDPLSHKHMSSAVSSWAWEQPKSINHKISVGRPTSAGASTGRSYLCSSIDVSMHPGSHT